MRKFLSVFVFCTSLWIATYSQFFPGSCNKQAPKISFSGKAPWAIDGKIKDWTTILGPYTGDNDMPFIPPATSAFNWVNDLHLFRPDGEMPKPENDMRFLAFTHDDYNVYFYLRRKLNGSTPNTFYYFFDVNADAVINLGEPVIHASFTNKAISELTLGFYIPDRDTAYSEAKKGNWIGLGDFGGPTVQSVNGYPMPGNVFDLFSSEFLFFPVNLRRNEILRAELTENGYGLELAIPWRYLKNWLTLKSPLDPGDIFFYKVSMQAGAGRYNSEKVVDNAGSCQGGPGISGNVNLDKSLTTTTLSPGSAYRFKLAYTNLTNAATEVGLEHIDLDFTPGTALPLTASDVVIKVYADKNCNGILDAGETASNYRGSSSVFDSCCHFIFRPPGEGIPGPGVLVVLPPFGKECFIIDMTLAPYQTVNKFKISFNSSVLFVDGKEPCEPGCGSKPLNPVGFVEAQVGSDQLTSKAQERGMSQEALANSDVILYPNPSRGIANLALPQNADISVVDNMGRSVQTINKAQAGIIQLKHLKAGFYIIKVRFVESGKVITKKLFIQP